MKTGLRDLQLDRSPTGLSYYWDEYDDLFTKYTLLKVNYEGFGQTARIQQKKQICAWHGSNLILYDFVYCTGSGKRGLRDLHHNRSPTRHISSTTGIQPDTSPARQVSNSTDLQLDRSLTRQISNTTRHQHGRSPTNTTCLQLDRYMYSSRHV